MSRHLTLAPFRGKLFNLRGLMCLILLSANTFHLRSASMESPAVSCDRYRKKVWNLNQEQTIKGADCTWQNGDSQGRHAQGWERYIGGKQRMGKVYRWKTMDRNSSFSPMPCKSRV